MPHDTFVLVKEYICSPTLRQRPLLVLTAESKHRFLLTTDRCLIWDYSFIVWSNPPSYWMFWAIPDLIHLPLWWLVFNFIFDNLGLHRKLVQGIMPDRQIASTLADGWRDLANIFENLLGGSAASRRAAEYLRALAAHRLPPNAIPRLAWHASPPPPQVIVAREEPHPVVLATLSPSVPLRAVWRRRWWPKLSVFEKTYHVVRDVFIRGSSHGWFRYYHVAVQTALIWRRRAIIKLVAPVGNLFLNAGKKFVL